MNDDEFLRNATDALDRWVDKKLARDSAQWFGGKPGEPVPEVDPDDLKTIWNVQQELQGGAIDPEIYRRLCKPGANIEATCYRAQLLALTARFIATEQLAPDNEGMLDGGVFRAAATVPMEWPEVGVVRQGFPFDVEHFLRLCGR